jgi:xanthine dehydrogenase accessory factor
MRPQTYIVVASHGNYDEEALSWALATNATYVALVASPTRAKAVVEYLRETGVSEANLARLKFPAGLDIGAQTPEEIALSILAETVQLRRRGAVAAPAQAAHTHAHEDGGHEAIEQADAPAATEALDPVCGMTVEIASARYKSEYQGQTYYFCAAGCQRKFEKEPAKYLS